MYLKNKKINPEFTKQELNVQVSYFLVRTLYCGTLRGTRPFKICAGGLVT